MKADLENQLERLEQATAHLDPNESERQLLNNEALNLARAFLSSIKETPAYHQNKKQIEGLAITGKKEPIENILATFKQQVMLRGVNAASGGHLGYIPGGGIYCSAIADYIAAVSNEYAGVYFGSPGAVAIEHEVVQWAIKLFGFPKSSTGHLSSGGSIANLTALTAARDAKGIKGALIEKSVIYLSAQVHHCIQKALRIIGLGDIIIRELDLDNKYRIYSKDLDEQIQKDKEAGLNPFLVIVSAGTTDTGAVDPLDAIAEISEKENLWFHIDGAYGGFFILCDSKKKLLSGISKADSLVIDPHKGLFIPYGVGIVLVKNEQAVLHSHHYLANYMQDAGRPDNIINPADVSPELTKHFRGLRVWLPLRLYGEQVFTDCLEEKLLLVQYFRAKVQKLGFQLGPEPDLSVSFFWFPRAEKENGFNQQLLAKMHEDGRVFFSSTIIDKRFVIRIAVLSFRTKRATIDRSLEMISDCLAAVLATNK